MTRVIPYSPRYKTEFEELNKEWISKHFVVEAMDVQQLEQAEETIIAPGGEIFFVLDGEEALGTCAMIPMVDEGVYELAKMAVSPKAQGRGYGNLLMQASIDWAKSKNATAIILHSNTVLEPAIKLYKKFGFETVYLGSHPDYDRANIEMRLQL